MNVAFALYLTYWLPQLVGNCMDPDRIGRISFGSQAMLLAAHGLQGVHNCGMRMPIQYLISPLAVFFYLYIQEFQMWAWYRERSTTHPADASSEVVTGEKLELDVVASKTEEDTPPSEGPPAPLEEEPAPAAEHAADVPDAPEHTADNARAGMNENDEETNVDTGML